MAGILKVDQVQSDSNLAFNIAGSNVAFMNATSLQMVGSNVSLAGTNVITNGKLVTAGLPVGAVLQVVQGITTTETSTSSSSYVDTGLSATITPSSASNKILIALVHTENEKTSGSASNRIGMSLLRNGAAILGGTSFTSGNLYTASALLLRGNISFNYLDSPASTSALTYKTQFRSNDGTSQVSVQVNGAASPSTMILMEIAA